MSLLALSVVLLYEPLAAADLATWIGGQGTVPYEQKTQQSPFLGLRSSPQPLQS